ncbi:protein of unknown function [Rhodovastum atsumiense]|nr:protein of unknown function [Rhodovastum atsumiense]
MRIPAGSSRKFLNTDNVFNVISHLYLLLSQQMEIREVNDPSLTAPLARRNELRGRNVFAAFPDNRQRGVRRI